MAAMGYGILVILGLVVDVGLIIRLRLQPVPWKSRGGNLATSPWNVEDFGILTGVLIVIHGLSLLLFQPAMRWINVPPDLIDTANFIMHGITFHLAGICIIFLMVRRRTGCWMPILKHQIINMTRSIGTGTMFYLAMLPVVATASLVAYTILTGLGHPVAMQEIAIQLLAMPNFWVRLYAVVLAIVIGPIFEEALFRGMLLPIIARHTGTFWAILLTSLGFAAFHMHLPSAATLATVAASCAIAYLATGKLAVAIVMHSLFNAVNLFLLFSTS